VYKVSAVSPVLRGYEQVRMARKRKLQQKGSGEVVVVIAIIKFLRGFHSVYLEWNNTA